MRSHITEPQGFTMNCHKELFTPWATVGKEGPVSNGLNHVYTCSLLWGLHELMGFRILTVGI